MSLPFIPCSSVYEYDQRLAKECKDCTRWVMRKPGDLIVPSSMTENPLALAIIGSRLGYKEVQTGEIMSGPTGKFMRNLLVKYIPEDIIARIYLTNVLKCGYDDEEKGGGLPAKHVNACSVHTANQLGLLRPKYVLACGADAIKLFFPFLDTVQFMYGQIYQDWVVCAPHFAQVFSSRNAELREKLERSIQVFWDLAQITLKEQGYGGN